MKRYLPLILIILLIGIVFITGLYHYFSFNSLKLYHLKLKTLVVMHPSLSHFLFIFVCITATALSLPSATILSILGGYLFPFPLSTLYVVVGGTCGATIIFYAARTAFGDLLKKKAGPFLRKMDAGFQKDAVSYLLFLRFIPIFPFWAINIAPAFFSVSIKTFVWTTFVGIIPGASVYTLVGRGLDHILETDKTFSLQFFSKPTFLIAFILLGILACFPIIVKKIKGTK